MHMKRHERGIHAVWPDTSVTGGADVCFRLRGASIVEDQ